MKGIDKRQATNHSQGSVIGIRGRLLIGFTLVVAVFALSAVISLRFIGIAKNDANIFLSQTMPANHAVIDLQANVVSLQTPLQKLVIFHDNSARKVLDSKMSALEQQISSVEKRIASVNDQSVSQHWLVLLNDMKSYKQKIIVVYGLLDANTPDKALEYYRTDILPLTDQMNDAFNTAGAMTGKDVGVLDVMTALLVKYMTDISEQLYFIFLSTLIFIAISLLLSYVIAIFTARSILIPVHYAIDIAKRIASGERDMKIEIKRNDEIGQLLEAMDVMLDSIQSGEEKIAQNATEIMQACSSMVSTLDEVRHAVDAQSSGASEQASSINQITASITEIEKSAMQTMTKAKDLGGVAEKTRQSGQRGLESIETSVMGMKSVRDRVQTIAQTILDLSRQTQQVGEITSVVNNLAQQSKMLALNASIEAAKAGDAGKGFAVVAAEVKNLAEQSEQSTSQVQKILEDIRIATEKAVMVTEEGTKGVDNGLQMIERTGEIIRDLNDVIREASIASQQIEAAVRQESAGIEQITAGMNEINTVTASFVESVGQTTEAMDNLANVTHRLKSSVDTINV